MNTTINLLKESEIRRVGTQALLAALGPIGMAQYLEEYDNGGTGDYTKEKYAQPDFSVEDVLAMGQEEETRAFGESHPYQRKGEAL